MQEAAAHLGQQAQNNHESSMLFLRQNMTNLAGFAVQMGNSLSAAVDKLKGEQVQVTPPTPPPPPPPDGARIKIAEKKALPPPKPSMPGSSNDSPPPASTSIFGYGPPAKKKKSEMELMAEEDQKLDKAIRAAKANKAKPKAKPTLVKQKDKKNVPVGVKKESTVPDHDQKLTKHGMKPIVHKKKEEEDKPVPFVEAPKTEYRPRKRKDAPPPPKTTILRKRPVEAGPPPKRPRRVSAHEI